MQHKFIKSDSFVKRTINELKRQFDGHQNVLMVLGESIFHCKSQSSTDFYRERIDYHLYMQDDLQNAVHRVTEKKELVFLPAANPRMLDDTDFDARRNLLDLVQKVSKLKRRLLMSLSDNNFDPKLIELFKQHFLHISLLYRPDVLLNMKG